MSGMLISIEKSNNDEVKSTASTAFCIKGTFDPDDITKTLGLTPSKSWKINDPIVSKKFQFDAGAKRPFSMWSYGYNDSYNGDISRQIRNTISDLRPRIPLIKEFVEKNNCQVYIQVVCDTTAGDLTPNFSIDTDIIDFCKLVGAKIDVDMNIF